jgi:hypothetical protein
MVRVPLSGPYNLPVGSLFAILTTESWSRQLRIRNSKPGLKVPVVGNEKEGGSGNWQMIVICLGPWRKGHLSPLVTDVLFSFNLAAILKKFCFHFRSLQPND